MKSLRRVALVVLIGGLYVAGSAALQDLSCQAAGAGTPTGTASGKPSGCIPLCCPDDYCPKPLPAIACLPKSCDRDSYCPKPLPRIPCPVSRGCTDAYCPKPMPRILCPVQGPWYTCGPADRR